MDALNTTIGGDLEVNMAPTAKPAETRVHGKRKSSYTKKVEGDWTDEESVKLIQLIQQQSIIWDNGCAEYKLPKEDVWKEIAASLNGKSVNNCKGKWNNLRTGFRTNLAKYRARKSGQGTDEKIPIVWKFFKDMMFLEAHSLRQSTQSTTSMPMTTTHSEENIFEDLEMSDMLTQEAIVQPTQGRKRHSSASDTKRSSTHQSPDTLPSTSSDFKTELREMTVRALGNISANVRVNDEFSAFGDYIASELRSLNADQAKFAKRKLARVFNDVIDEALSMPSHQDTVIHVIPSELSTSEDLNFTEEF